MDLSARLRLLQQASGRRPSAVNGAAAPHALQAARHEATRHEADQRAAEHDLAQRLGARLLAPGLLLREETLAAGYRHGDTRLDALALLLHAPFGVSIPPLEQGWWFMDTETTGLAGGTGTLVFLYGGLSAQAGALTLQQWLLTRFAAEAPLLQAVQQSLRRHALLVSFNGKCFDLPLLRTRCRLQGEVLQEAGLQHLDLLHPARSAFAARWPDVRLQTAERRLCAVQRQDDLPGSEAPAAFQRWLRGHDGHALARVLRHHRDDVLSLASLAIRLTQAYRDPLRHDADEAGILRRLRRSGYRLQAGQSQLALTP